MNTVRKISPCDSIYNTKDKSILSLVRNEIHEEKKVVDGKILSKEYLNEKLAYFYEHGGPIMEL